MMDPRVARSRAKLVDAATELLIEAGPRAVTVDAVAERSGVAKSTLYRHWASREDLLVEVMRCKVPDVAPPDASLGFEPSLRLLMRRLATTLCDPDWRAIMPALVSLEQHMPELAQVAHRDRDEKFRVLEEVLDKGVSEGILPPGLNTDLVARILIGPVVFTVLSTTPGDEPALIEETADFVVDRFLASYRR